MALFGIPTIGFCMVLQYPTVVFSATGPIFGPPYLGVGSSWPRAPFLQENMCPKLALARRGLWAPGSFWAPLGLASRVRAANHLIGLPAAVSSVDALSSRCVSYWHELLTRRRKLRMLWGTTHDTPAVACGRRAPLGPWAPSNP